MQYSMQATKTSSGALTIPPAFVRSSLRYPLFELCILQSDQLGVRIPATVVLDQEVESFLLLSICHEEPGRFGDEEHRADHDNRPARLEDEGDPPGVVVLDVIAAERDGGGGYDVRWLSSRVLRVFLSAAGVPSLTDRSTEPATVVQAYKTISA
jgi:hypothetical protein